MKIYLKYLKTENIVPKILFERFNEINIKFSKNFL